MSQRSEMFEEPQATQLSSGKIAALAERTAKQLKFGPGDDASEVVARLGGKVEDKDFFAPNADTGAIIVHGENDFEIYVPALTSSERLRFTIAHELGHYILHYLWAKSGPQQRHFNLPLKASRYGSSLAEDEANWFAAAFLMPEHSFKERFKKSKGDLSEVADQFKVSIGTAKVRAVALGLLKDDGKY